MPYGKYLTEPVPDPPAYYPNSIVVVNGQNGNDMSSSSSSSSLQKIIDSGVPITGGNSAGSVASTAAGLEGLAGLNFDFNGLFDLIREQTNYNNAWSAAQAQKQMDFQTQANQIAMDFNAAEAAKNRDWQQMMSNTAHQREIQDLKAAGLNPVLSATGGNGAAVTSGSAASGVTSSGAQADADQSANTAMAAIYGSIINAQTQMHNANLSAQTNLRMAEMQQAASMYGAQLAAEASKYGAGVNAAAMQYSAEQSRYASQYASDQTYKNNQEQREWNLEHPQTNAGIVSAVQNELQQRQSWIREKGKEYLDKYLDVPPWLANMFS